MGDVDEGGCVGEAFDALDEGDFAGQAADGAQEGFSCLHEHKQQRQQQEGSSEVDGSVTVGDELGAQKACAAASAAAKAAVGGSKAASGKLVMHVWNDTAALFDLEAEEGVGIRAAGFGGSAREA